MEVSLVMDFVLGRAYLARKSSLLAVRLLLATALHKAARTALTAQAGFLTWLM
jgi:hypothetical protein